MNAVPVKEVKPKKKYSKYVPKDPARAGQRGGPNCGQGRKKKLTTVLSEQERAEIHRHINSGALQGAIFLSELIKDKKAPVQFRVHAATYLLDKCVADAVAPKSDEDEAPDYEGVEYLD